MLLNKPSRKRAFITPDKHVFSIPFLMTLCCKRILFFLAVLLSFSLSIPSVVAASIGSTLYVANYGDSTVDLVNVNSSVIEDSLSIPSPVALAFAGSTMYVASYSAGAVYPIDAQTSTLTVPSSLLSYRDWETDRKSVV